jgi:hypothetical protein
MRLRGLRTATSSHAPQAFDEEHGTVLTQTITEQVVLKNHRYPLPQAFSTRHPRVGAAATGSVAQAAAAIVLLPSCGCRSAGSESGKSLSVPQGKFEREKWFSNITE